MIKPEDLRVTYTSSSVDWTVFHRFFDEALAGLRARFGETYPLYIAGEAVYANNPTLTDKSPIDGALLAHFQAALPAHVDQAVAAARAAQKAWGKRPYPERIAILRQAAHLIRQRKFELGALMSLEVGKNRLESMGDAEESADLIDYYCDQMENHRGYIQEMSRITPIETNTDILRPYGVFACIAPFNFPAALAFGMSSAALVAGNAVIFKPSTDTPWTGLKVYEIYRDAGVPAGVLQFITGRGKDVGDHLTFHPGVDGVVFTGSKAVGMHIFHGISQRWIKPCLLELGGKNAAIVTETADLDMAAEGISRSAWGLQNQKCSACSRVYVHRDVADALIEKLIARSQSLVIGDPCEKDVYLGPVINEAAVRTYEAAIAKGLTEGATLLAGGHRLTEGALARGHYVAPTLLKAPLSSHLFRDEFFVPILAIGVVDSLEQAIYETNQAEYGLTGGIYSGRDADVERYFDEAEVGLVYANKRTGATTGAWPGAQPFTGWKGSGGSGKGGCGPYYVAQFMREQCRTVVVEGR